jgi:SPP1 gp7 family putative phage head morphogenesis protein
MALRDDMTKHRIFVQRLAGTELDNILEQLNLLKKVAIKNTGIDISINALRHRLREVVKSMSSIAIDNMTDIAKYESEFSAGIWNKYFDGDIKSVDSEELRKALISTNIALNNVKTKSESGKQKLIINENAVKKSLKTTYDQFGRKKADELSQIIKDGKVQKLETSEIVKNVEERVSGLFTAQAATLATTAINYTTNVAKSETIDANKESIKQEMWVTDLEPGTCGYCEDQDGTIYDAGDAPECPVHYNCNCEVIPYDEV